MQTVMSATPRANKIRIKTHVGEVQAPLPDNIGFSVGSEYSSPFEANLLSGTLGKIAIASGRAPKVGISTTKFYTSPEPSEISLDLEFNAYYSAREEVVVPVARLMVAALGIETTYREMKEELQEMLRKIRGFAGFGNIGTEEGEMADNRDTSTIDDIERDADELSEIIGFIRAPSTTSIIYIGSFCVLDNVYISSVTPQFSNVVDANGYPLSATVSLTAVLRKSPTANDMARAFSVGSVGSGVLSNPFRGDA